MKHTLQQTLFTLADMPLMRAFSRISSASGESVSKL